MKLFGKRKNEDDQQAGDSNTGSTAAGQAAAAGASTSASETGLADAALAGDKTTVASDAAYKGRHASNGADKADAGKTEVVKPGAGTASAPLPATTAIPAIGATKGTDATGSAAQGPTAFKPIATAGSHAQLADSAQMAGAKKPFNTKRLLIVLGIIAAVIVALYVCAALFFSSHFGFSTTIGEVDASFKTVAEVEQLLADNAADYTLDIVEREDKTEQISGDDIDFSYSGQDGQVQAILDQQQPFLFITRLWNHEDQPIEVSYDYDKDKLQAAIQALDCVTNPKPVAPQDAYPEFDGSHYVVHPEVPGTTIDAKKLSEVLEQAVGTGSASVNIDEQGCYVAPKVTSESPDLVDRIEKLDEYVPFALTYTFPDGQTEQLDGAEIFDWLTINDDGSYAVDDDKLLAWVNDFCERHTTIGRKRVFTSVDGNTYEVEGGTYGWSIDADAEAEAIRGMLETKKSETREPYWLTRAAAVTTGDEPDWGNTYIDLNLTTQHMYFVKDGESVFEADVVTGLPGSRATPAGVYYVLEKMRNKVLRGEMTSAGVPEYETPVSYWLRMTWTGVGFHDASWQPWFGGDRYLTNGSHGCINMSYSDVAALYDLAYVDCPIVSHY